MSASALSSPAHDHAIPICFGYETALRIARAANAGGLVPIRGRNPKLPERPPNAGELHDAIARLERAFPSLRIDNPCHTLVGCAERYHATASCKPHTCTFALAGASFLRFGDDILVCAPPLAFMQEATRTSSEIALIEQGWELCGSYQTTRTAQRSAYQVPPLTSTRAMREYARLNHSIDGARKVARVLRYLADGSASPRETKQALTLGLPMRRGGYGIGIPQMNYEVAASREARAITGKSSFRCDLCWPEAKLDVEYQSRESHEGEARRISDSRRANALAVMGWTVLGVTNDELDSLVATDTIARSICKRLGKRYQVSTPEHHARKLQLRRQLGLRVGYESG